MYFSHFLFYLFFIMFIYPVKQNKNNCIKYAFSENKS